MKRRDKLSVSDRLDRCEGIVDRRVAEAERRNVERRITQIDTSLTERKDDVNTLLDERWELAATLVGLNDRLER
jgi:hypothetical protein